MASGQVNRTNRPNTSMDGPTLWRVRVLIDERQVDIGSDTMEPSLQFERQPQPALAPAASSSTPETIALYSERRRFPRATQAAS